MRDPRRLSRFGNATRQAETYRRGRVLLAGDAAHMHFPAGGPGLNVGVQDATNLGWKLAAVLRGTATDGLLDSYHGERHPVGAELLLNTRAQTALMTTYAPEGQALRGLLGEFIATVPEFSQALAERMSGLSVVYPPAEGASAHPLTGRRAPDLRFADGRRLFELLRGGGRVLLDLTGGAAAGLPGRTPDTVVHTAPLAPHDRDAWRRVTAAPVRPDGHVAWAAEETDPETLTRSMSGALTAMAGQGAAAVR
ncbi:MULTISPECIES: FAD-dependent monooxygenase [Streptomyces]|uniref:FAD-dependent monooxygenase n=1 Tax=Streptomyces TaxID=1883 RepID=UPI001187897D|nr:FAD-dependent monooxygenase [Streptomyces murinus]MBA9044653.1 hypothetical protein [Streptomyces murinus]BBC97248.1 monooxygenase [Streptomyces rochei]